jgi:hypothetical protein
MEMVQLYETTVGDRESGQVVRFLSIPGRSIAITNETIDHPTQIPLADALGIHELHPVRPSDLAKAILLMLRAEDATNVENLQAQAVLTQFFQAQSPTDPLMSFAEQIAYTDLIPFEESPVGLVSLASKAAKLANSPVALGAFIGVIAGGTSPFVLIAVPAGIILCGAAKVISEALDKNRDRILERVLGLSCKTTSRMKSEKSRKRTIDELRQDNQVRRQKLEELRKELEESQQQIEELKQQIVEEPEQQLAEPKQQVREHVRESKQEPKT